MKKIMLTLVMAILVTGCLKREDFCERPPMLHPVTACTDCTWQEL